MSNNTFLKNKYDQLDNFFENIKLQVTYLRFFL